MSEICAFFTDNTWIAECLIKWGFWGKYKEFKVVDDMGGGNFVRLQNKTNLFVGMSTSS